METVMTRDSWEEIRLGARSLHPEMKYQAAGLEKSCRVWEVKVLIRRSCCLEKVKLFFGLQKSILSYLKSYQLVLRKTRFCKDRDSLVFYKVKINVM